MRSRLVDHLVLSAAVLGVLTLPLSHPAPSRAKPVSQVALRSADTADRVALLNARASRTRELAETLQVRPAPGKITSPFGERRRHERHPGIDIDGETGDPVAAAAFGTVSYAGIAPKGFTGYGLLVVIDHGPYITAYAHLSRIDVAAGQVVPAGTQVGAIGKTGIATGSHLHFEVRVNNKPVDPATIFRFF